MKLPPRSPNLNTHVERVFGSIREECLDRFVIFSKRHLEYLLREYIAHYHEECLHQGLGYQLIHPNEQKQEEMVKRSSRLGGLLNHYYRA